MPLKKNPLPKKPLEKKPEEKKESVKRGRKTIELLRGFRDILPEEQKYWDFVEEKVRHFAYAYSFLII